MATLADKVDLANRKYLSRPEAAEYLGVAVRTIDRMLALGELRRRRVRGRVLVLRDDLDRIANNGVE